MGDGGMLRVSAEAKHRQPIVSVSVQNLQFEQGGDKNKIVV